MAKQTAINRNPITVPQREGDVAVRCAAVCLAEAQGYEGNDNKQFSVIIMFDKKNPLHKAAVVKHKADLEACLAELYPDPATRPRDTIFANKPHLGPKCPIKDGDVACNEKNIPLVEEHPANAGHWIVRAACAEKDRPHVLDASGAVIDRNTCKSGYWYKVNINAYAYRGGSGGVTTSLNGIQLIREDGILGGGGVPPADTMFDSVGAAEYKDGSIGDELGDELGGGLDGGDGMLGDAPEEESIL